jgi:anthranilate synthase component 2
MQSVLVIDNYDSFTYNLVHYLEALNCKVIVMRNDQIDYIIAEKINKIIISPGSGLPRTSGNLLDFIKHFAKSKSILGICLGQQAIVEFFGGKLIPLRETKHGVSCFIKHSKNDVIYKDIPIKFKVGLYFSWQVTDLPENLLITSKSDDGTIMSVKHKKYDIRALQYHPESIMTPKGKQILKNWLEI